MNPLHFKAVIKIIRVNPYVLVSAEQVKELKLEWKKPSPVLVQVNGKPDQPWHINIMPVGDGSFYLYLAGVVRKESNTKVGDEVEIDLSFDQECKSGPIPIPDWIKEVLNKNPKALENWEKLIPSRQKEILRYLTNLKSDEARDRNLDKAIQMLSGKRGRFMGRSWKDGI
jgi:hypothetical protein